MADRNSLGERMKRYESVSQSKLLPRMATIIRIDGKAFHTFTKAVGFRKPFDDNFMKIMWYTAARLVEEVQTAVLAYIQSDEISILLNDWKRLNTQQWFDGKIQKITSVSSSIATAEFNRQFFKRVVLDFEDITSKEAQEYINNMYLARFDSRVFNVPKEDVTNYFVWRQQDAVRNSIQMLARTYFSHKQCYGLSCNELQEKLFQEKGVNWDKLPTCKKRGTAVVRKNSKWIIDYQVPTFTKNRDYIGILLEREEE